MGPPWEFPKGSLGFLRLSQAFLGSLRVPQGSFGFLWVPLGSFGFLRVPQGSLGFLSVPWVPQGCLDLLSLPGIIGLNSIQSCSFLFISPLNLRFYKYSNALCSTDFEVPKTFISSIHTTFFLIIFSAVKYKIIYRTSVKKGRAHSSKFLFLPSHCEIKTVFQPDCLRGRPLIESYLYWKEYGTRKGIQFENNLRN